MSTVSQRITDTVAHSPSGSAIVGQPQILFDGKTLGAAQADAWSSAGDGTIAWSASMTDLSVDVGEYAVRYSTTRIPYFSGYPITAEFTFDGFANEAGVVKRVGYFSSSAVAPYSAALDGFWLEADGDTYRIKAANAGTTTVDIPLASWSGRADLAGYDWDQFTVVMFDHLWLGGAALRVWIVTPDRGWVLAHSTTHAGLLAGTMTRSPNQHMRYDIYSSTGTGSMGQICCQCSTLGPVSGNAYTRSAANVSGIACNSTSTVYALQGIKRIAAYRDTPVRLERFGSTTGSQNDTGLLYLLRNPTLSAGLSYSALHRVNHAVATTQTVTDLGEVLAVAASTQSADFLTEDSYNSWLKQGIDDSFDEYVLAFSPMTTNQTLRGMLSWKEFA